MKHLLGQKLVRWLINKLSHDRVRSKIPTWVLRYLVNRNFHRRHGVHPDKCYWADLELCLRGILICPVCYKDIKEGERKHTTCLRFDILIGPENPTGVPEWLVKESEAFGYGGEMDHGRSCSFVDQDDRDSISCAGEG